MLRGGELVVEWYSQSWVMKLGFGSAEGWVWRIRVRADCGFRDGWVERRWAIMRVVERDLPIALGGG